MCLIHDFKSLLELNYVMMRKVFDAGQRPALLSALRLPEFDACSTATYEPAVGTERNGPKLEENELYSIGLNVRLSLA